MRINKDQISFSRWKDFKFSYRRGQGCLASFLLNRLQWHLYPRWRYIARFPLHLDLEISALCNMRCPMCFTTTDDFTDNIHKGFMDFSLFKKLIDEAVQYKLYSVRISHRGESFIHPEVIDFIAYAKKAGIREVASLSNILALTPELFERAMKAGLDWLTISFDGLKETYEKIRKPAQFDDAVRKIKDYKRIKDIARSCKPAIKIQSVWPAVKDCVNDYIKLFEPYVDTIASNPLIDYLHKDDPSQIEFWDNFDCPVPYQRLTVLFNGLVPYCHNDEFATFIIGDAKTNTIYNIWNGKDMMRIRKIHKEHRGTECIGACKRCFLPRKVGAVIEDYGRRKITVEKYTKRTETIGK